MVLFVVRTTLMFQIAIISYLLVVILWLVIHTDVFLFMSFCCCHA